MFHFIVFLVPIYYSFCVCFISYIFVCYSFHYKYFCNYPTKKKNPIPGTRALQISSHLSIACSQALLQLAFFHRLPHLWLSTVLLKVHHFISLCFLLFALHFAFVTIPASRFGSHRHCHKPHLALRFWPRYNTHTHTLSLSLSHTHIFPSAFALLHSVTSRLHITHLGLTPRILAAHHASRPLVTLLSCTSHISTLHHTSRLLILPLVFYCIFVLVLRPSLSRTVSHLGFTSRISASRHTPRLRITRLALHIRKIQKVLSRT